MTSWESVSRWYDEEVGSKGHYYHQNLIIPTLLSLLQGDSILDLACGQGVLSRHLKEMLYVGIDLSKSLIAAAKSYRHPKNHQFHVGDITQPLLLDKKDFANVVINLAFQNIEQGKDVLQNAYQQLSSTGKLFLVLNHPCFRIPRQSSWGVDEKKQLQYRRMDRYATPLKIPIEMHPGKQDRSVTWSFHQPLSVYTEWLKEAGFAVESMKELFSNKKSSGVSAKRENRAREEFPLFLLITAFKRER
jgi:ubiquinone/menaquinone biosynthesis C-methylase UbiE